MRDSCNIARLLLVVVTSTVTLFSLRSNSCESFSLTTTVPRRSPSRFPSTTDEQNSHRISSLPSSTVPENTPRKVKITTKTVTLKSGTNAETVTASPPPTTTTTTPRNDDDDDDLPALIFVHGSFHASWCWAEHYLPHFAGAGYPSLALSLRGTGGTFAGDGVTSVKIAEHVDDLAAFVESVFEDDGTGRRRPVFLIGHSFGGAVLTKYLEEVLSSSSCSSLPGTRRIGGAGFLCSVPPSGNGKMTGRFLRRSLVDSWKVTRGLAMKKCVTDVDLCRTLFFGEDEKNEGGVDDEEIVRIQGYFKRDSVATIDIGDFVKRLPSKGAIDGKAPFLKSMKKKALVVGASDDFIVDREGVLETAAYFDVDPVFVDSPHDIMLGSKWQNGADEILKWLQNEE